MKQENSHSIPEDKKLQILKAAQQVFARYGYYKSTMDDIAQAMGMRKGSLYYYYKSKDEIFRDVILTESQQFLKELAKAISPIKVPRKKIIRLINFRLEYFQQVVNLHQLTIQAVLEFKPLVVKLYKNYMDQEIQMLADIIEAGIRRGDFRKCDTSQVARAILTLSEAIKFREFHTTNALSAADIDYTLIRQEIEYIVNLILDGLAQKPETAIKKSK